MNEGMQWHTKGVKKKLKSLMSRESLPGSLAKFSRQSKKNEEKIVKLEAEAIKRFQCP